MQTLLLSWAMVGLQPAVLESPAIGPDWLIAGTAGQLAWYSPVYLQLQTAKERFQVPPLQSATFLPDGSIVALSGRRLIRYQGPEPVQGLELPGFVPPNGTLLFAENQLWMQDSFKNRHRVAAWSAAGLSLAESPELQPPLHRIHKEGSQLLRDGLVVWDSPNLLGGYALGEWVVAEERNEGRVQRHLIRDDINVTVSCENRIYVPYQDIVSSNDQVVYLLCPQSTGLQIQQVSP